MRWRRRGCTINGCRTRCRPSAAWRATCCWRWKAAATRSRCASRGARPIPSWSRPTVLPAPPTRARAAAWRRGIDDPRVVPAKAGTHEHRWLWVPACVETTPSHRDGPDHSFPAEPGALDRVGAAERILVEHFAERRARQVARGGVEPLDNRLVFLGRGRLRARLLQRGDSAIRRAGGRDEAAGRERVGRKAELA